LIRRDKKGNAMNKPDNRPDVSNTRQFSRRTALGRAAGAGIALASAIALPRSSVSASQLGAVMAQATPSPVSGNPTVILVHGAFADGSSWSGVIERLQASGVQVQAPANPLRGISADSAYTASVFAQTPGPILAVGHSYGGAVISNAATNATNVAGLVFVAAFSPDEGEKLQDVTAKSKDAILGTALVQLKYPTGQGAGTEVEFGINPNLFHDVFAADLPAKQAAVMAATQRPVSALAFGEPNGSPAWKKLPSWAVVATDDKAAGTDIVRSMAERAGAQITEVIGSHVIMVSQPQAVTDVILKALAAVK
jgi:pimeloyl-ACP methyl ester carboxylesterase